MVPRLEPLCYIAGMSKSSAGAVLRAFEGFRLYLHSVRSFFDGEKISTFSNGPPVPEERPFEKRKHGRRWQDPYHWMREDETAALEHLRRENSYTEAFMADTLCLQKTLEQEMASRLQREAVSSPPERIGPWLYYMKLPVGKEYPVFCRRKYVSTKGVSSRSIWSQIAANAVWPNQSEEILLDQNSLVEQFGYAQVGTCRLSKDHARMAFTLDTTGTEAFSLYVKDLRTGQVMNWEKRDSVVSVEWASNGRTIYCTVADSLLRPWRVLSRTLNPHAEDVLVLEERDASRFVDVSRTKDWSFITLNVNSKTSSENAQVYLLSARDSTSGLRLVHPRKSGIQYFVEHNEGFLYMLTNNNLDVYSNERASCNHRLVRTSLEKLGLDNDWQEVIGTHRDAIIEDMEMFEKHIVLYLRFNGLPRVQVLDLPWVASMNSVRTLSLPQKICTVISGANEDFQTDVLRVSTSSPNMPEAILEYNLNSGEVKVLQQDEVVGRTASSHSKETKTKRLLLSGLLGSTFASSQIEKRADQNQNANSKFSNCFVDLLSEYICQRHEAISEDGVPVPLTIVHSRDLERKGKHPALLLGYGAYGQPFEADWCSERLSLLDRGWVVAFAHVRGGGELGKAWHECGRLFKKRNSFEDFVGAANYLINEGYAHQGKLAAWGVSAGGLLVAASVNLHPNLFKAVVLEVPFLDISNTLLDRNLPLSVHEYDEWGNPDDMETFAYIQSYAPYDNVQIGTTYPAALVKSGYLDTRVGYWEAAKWVARLRRSIGPEFSKAILLKTNMDTGHFAEGGRFGRLRDVAHDYSFLIKAMES